MVKEYEKLSNFYKKFKKDYLQDKKRFSLEDLEDYMIDKSGGVSNYEQAGGYSGLYYLLKKDKEKEEVTAIKSSPYNNRRPPLKKRWQLSKNKREGWPDELVFKLSRYLNLSYYLKRPRLQTAELAENLKRINNFLISRDKREWASREERSLELFAYEKFLASSEGKKLLNRLKLSLADIKAEKYSQMFVFWQQESGPIEEILILENHSAFIACKRALESGYSILSFTPDTLIYGAGKHIIDSFKFLREIAEPERVKVKYAGDIDPEGLAIYSTLKEKYPIPLSLHFKYYRTMINKGENGYPLQSKQQKKRPVLDSILREIKAAGYPQMAAKIADLWWHNLRVPQEVISYEVIKNDVAEK